MYKVCCDKVCLEFIDYGCAFGYFQTMPVLDDKVYVIISPKGEELKRHDARVSLHTDSIGVC